MAEARKRAFTIRTIEALKRKGRYADPGARGLYLQVASGGSKSWIYRYKTAGRFREMGLGPYPAVGLREARQLAFDAQRERLAGLDPIEARNARRRAETERKSGMTFTEAAARYIESHRHSWKNEKHAKQWTATLEAYAFPVIGAKPVKLITAADIRDTLSPIWLVKHETASRLRGRIEKILDWCTTLGHRSGLNPARWKANLDHLLPNAPKGEVRHHAALAWEEMPRFLRELRLRDGMAARALEFAIFTAARSGEARGARWDEIDIEAGVWTVPAHRMKAKRAHRVPLSSSALKLLASIPRLAGSPLVFPSPMGKVFSDAALSAVLRRMGSDFVPHGFRATFRQWAAESTDYPGAAVELALAHVNKDKTEAAYQRSDLLERRRELMQDWADYCECHK